MKMSKNLVKAFNDQINREFYSAYLYLAMANDLDAKNYRGMAHWMDLQYKEEVEHAEGLLRWLRRRGEKVTLAAIEQPKQSWKTIREIFAESLEHEQFVSDCIMKMAELAKKEKDPASAKFLDWYIMEQVEEEENAQNNLDDIDRAGDSVCALQHLDAAFGARESEGDGIPYLD